MRWEYFVKELPGTNREQTDFLDNYGDAGWELVAVVGNTAYLKRPILWTETEK